MTKLERFLMGDFDLAGLSPAGSTTELPASAEPAHPTDDFTNPEMETQRIVPSVELLDESIAEWSTQRNPSAARSIEDVHPNVESYSPIAKEDEEESAEQALEDWLPVDLCDDLDQEQLLVLIHRLCAQGFHLRALSAVRIFAQCGNEAEAHHALARLLEVNGPESTDPLPSDFLGTSRSRMAWSVLRRDTLRLVPHTDAPTSDKEWIVTLDMRARPGASEGWALIWSSSTATSRSVRPAGQRKKARRKLRLPAEISIWRANAREPIRAQVEVVDISQSGAGIRLNDRYGRLGSIDLKGCRIRLQVSMTESGSVATLAVIRRFETSATGDCTMGVEFNDPPSEFTAAVTNLLTLQRGDLQYLWSAWDTLARKQ